MASANAADTKKQHYELSIMDQFFQWSVSFKIKKDIVFENHRKSLIQHCERSELLLHLEWTKVD